MRSHTAKGGGKVREIGLTGLSCKDCDLETKQERGCHLPGYSFRAEYPWKFDHRGHRLPEDFCYCCPTSVVLLRPEYLLIVARALEIESGGGVHEETNEGRGDLDAWYVDAYDLVMAAKSRAQAEAQKLADSFAEQAQQQLKAQQQQRLAV